MKRYAPATDRNREAILTLLRDNLPGAGTVLEIASGSGQHAVFFARHHPHLSWQPSDADPHALASIRAWSDEAALPNLLPPVLLDVTHDTWPLERADAILNINMIHIAPWRACEALMAGAGRALPPGGALILYGPYRVQSRPTAPSNEAFDRSLRAQDPEWGLRHLHEVVAEAEASGLALESVHEMPANNLTVVLRRRAA